MRLADVDELWKQMWELREKRDEEANMTGDRAVCVTWNDAVTLIKNAPTIDAVPVVRCKDCKYYDAENHNCLDEMAYARIWNEDDYCSFAERREER